MLKLIRYEDDGNATRGLLFYRKKFLVYTLERPWLDNKPYESCIPPGDYELRPWTRPNRDNVFILSGGSVCTTPDLIDPDKGLTRCLILIHVANRADQVQGCIAPGSGTYLDPAGYSVQNSRDGMTRLHHALKPQLSTDAYIPIQIREARP